jgi:lipopolysaccharide exporter
MAQRGDWGRAMKSGVLWSNASFVATRAVSTVSLLVLARLLTPSEFGLVAAITVYLALMELMSDLGMKATVVYEQEEGHTHRVQNAFTVNLLLSAAVSVLGVLLAPLIADFFRVGDETWLFRLAALNPLLRGLGNIHDSLLLRGMRFRARALPELVLAAVRGIVSVTLALAGLGAEALVIGMLAGTASWTIVHWIRTPFRPTFAFDLEVVRSMASYGSGATALNVISAVALRVDQAAIGRVLGERALGLYTVAFRIPELLIESVSWNMSRVAFPGLSRQRMADEQGVLAATRRIVHFQALYAVPLAAGLAVLGTPLIVTLFGAPWEAAGGVASAVAVTSGLSAVGFPLGDTFKALGRQRVLVVLNVVQLPIYVGVIVAVASEGILAVAWARTGAELLHLALVAIAASRLLEASIAGFARAAWPGCAAGIGMLLGAGAVRIAWPDLSLLPLLAGGAAGLLGAAVSLRLLAPGAFREIADLVVQLRRRGRAVNA